MDSERLEQAEAAIDYGAMFSEERQAEIHRRICALREEKDLSYRDLADITYLSESTIVRYFTGKTKVPQFYVVATLVAAMGGSLDEIIGLTPASVPAENPYQELLAAYQENILYQREHIGAMEANIRRANTSSLLILILLLLVIAGVIALFVYDFTHPDRGWWQQAMDAARGLLYAYL